jgi:Mn2+/Fe2+ NRAMP family transporter
MRVVAPSDLGTTTGLLAVPVLAGSAAYAIGEACKWKVSLEHAPANAPRFYATIALATLIGLAMNFTHVDPIKALFWAAVLNGITAAPLMAVIMFMSSDRRVMGKFVVPFHLKLFGWLATAVMFGVSTCLFATLYR